MIPGLPVKSHDDVYKVLINAKTAHTARQAGPGNSVESAFQVKRKAQPSDTVLSGCPLIQGMTLERQFPCLSEMGVYSQHGIKYSPSCRVGKFSLIRRRVCAAEAVNTQTILQGRLQHVRIMHHDNSTDIFNVYQHVWRSYG